MSDPFGEAVPRVYRCTSCNLTVVHTVYERDVEDIGAARDEVANFVNCPRCNMYASLLPLEESI